MGGGLLQLVAYGAQDVYLTGNPQIEIGGQKIDKHYSHWMYIWNELSLPKSKKEAYKKMVGSNNTIARLQNANLYIPLEFWFCRNVGLALPLIALQYHEVKINILFEEKTKCQGSTSAIKELSSVNLWVDYIFLDTDERRRFAQLSHEYLIEQLQFTGAETVNAVSMKPKLSFNHPCKELVWVSTCDYHLSDQHTKNNNWVNYSTTVNTYATDTTLTATTLHAATSVVTSTNPVVSAKLVLNGNDRFSLRPGSYFNLIQPYQHHENIPSNPGINVYSFALKPEEHQPSGTLNMSRIDTAVLNIDMTPGYINNGFSKNLHVYAVNYNVLRILSGMGGLAYSN